MVAMPVLEAGDREIVGVRLPSLVLEGTTWGTDGNLVYLSDSKSDVSEFESRAPYSILI